MSWIDDAYAGTLDLSNDWTSDLPTPGIPDAADMYDRTTQREIDLAVRLATLGQRVQMVQTTAQSIAADSNWHTLTGMSKAQADHGVDEVNGMGAISGGLITMPTGSAGQWLVTGQVSVQNAAGMTTVRGAVLLNGNRVIAGGSNAAGSTAYQSAWVPAFEFAIADGDTIGLQAFVSGAGTTSSTLAANGTFSYLRLVKLA